MPINPLFLMAIVGVLVYGALWYMGIAYSWVATIFLVAAIVFMAKGLKVKFFSPIPVPPQFAFVIALLAFGLFALFSGGLDYVLNTNIISPASYTGGGKTIDTGVYACAVSNPELLGKAATPTVNAYNRESKTPYSAAVDVTTTYVYKWNVVAGSWDYAGPTTDTSAYPLSSTNGFSFVVGDKIRLVGSGTSYYVDEKVQCITGEGEAIELDAHAVFSEASMTLTAKDEYGNALTTGDATLDDYEISLGASATDTFLLILKNNQAVKLHNFCGYAVKTMGDVKSISFTGANSDAVLYEKENVADFLDSATITINEDPIVMLNSSSYETVFVTDKPIPLKEWQDIQFEFKIEAGTTDPAETTNATRTVSNADLAIFLALDCAWAQGSDGQPYLDYYAHTSAEGNVGVSETTLSPLGGTAGVIIEAT
jgi:hypothetical protein